MYTVLMSVVYDNVVYNKLKVSACDGAEKPMLA
jgi:hypothetical protein